MRPDIGQGEIGRLDHAPKRRRHDGSQWHGRFGDLQELFVQGEGLAHRFIERLGRILDRSFEHGGTLVRHDQPVHDGESLERVLGVEDTGLVGAIATSEEGALGIGPIDSRAADHDREFQIAMAKLFHTERHLLAGGDQQRGEADGGGVDFDGFFDDPGDRDLFAQVVHGVTVVAEDRIDQVLADVVDVAIDRREHDHTFGGAFDPFHIGFELGDRPFHHLGRLEDEGKDQLAGAELVADFLHGR